MANDSLVVLWTSGDKEVATKMVFMYTMNSRKKNWWNAVTFIVWGPSAKLLSEDLELQKKIAEMKSLGIKLEACKGCSDQYGVSSALENLGIEVKYMGGPLTNYLKGEHRVLTF
jgi:hypothetical protein